MFGRKIELGEGWGVLHVDPQVDFMEGGALAVKGGHDVIDPINQLTDIARRRGVPVAMSADWHPEDTVHFQEFGGPWPVHCVAETAGAAFGPGIDTQGVEIFHKGMSNSDDGYSPWEGTSATTGRSLGEYLAERGVQDLIVDGLATDYCVKAGVLDARKQGLTVYVVKDAIRAVEANRGDRRRAIREMKRAGAQFISSRRIAG